VFWTIYGLFALVESFTDTLLFWFPLYPTAKVIFLVVLQIPQLQLAAMLYKKFVRPWFVKHQNELDAVAREGISKATQIGTTAVQKGQQAYSKMQKE